MGDIYNRVNNKKNKFMFSQAGDPNDIIYWTISGKIYQIMQKTPDSPKVIVLFGLRIYAEKSQEKYSWKKSSKLISSFKNIFFLKRSNEVAGFLSAYSFF